MAPSSKKKRVSQENTDKTLPESFSLDEEQQKAFETKLKRIKRNTSNVETPGVVYLGSIPHGFFEPQMRKFFTQFGRVKRLRLSRSKKTGRSKGYAFIEFECDEVAKIVAETMNNYLMFERLMKCKYMPADTLHPELFKGSQRKFRKPKSHLMAIQRHNNKNLENKQENTARRFLKKHQKKMEALKEMGLELKVKNVNEAVREAKRTILKKKEEREERSNKKEDAQDQQVSQSEKTLKRKSSEVKTPQSKKMKSALNDSLKSGKGSQEKDEGKKDKGGISIQTKDNKTDQDQKMSKQEKTKTLLDIEKVKTPQNKKVKLLEPKSEPPKSRRKGQSLPAAKKLKSIKKPTVSSVKKKRLAI